MGFREKMGARVSQIFPGQQTSIFDTESEYQGFTAVAVFIELQISRSEGLKDLKIKKTEYLCNRSIFFNSDFIKLISIKNCIFWCQKHIVQIFLFTSY